MAEGRSPPPPDVGRDDGGCATSGQRSCDESEALAWFEFGFGLRFGFGLGSVRVWFG